MTSVETLVRIYSNLLKRALFSVAEDNFCDRLLLQIISLFTAVLAVAKVIFANFIPFHYWQALYFVDS
jgi:hypothetical protein